MKKFFTRACAFLLAAMMMIGAAGCSFNSTTLEDYIKTDEFQEEVADVVKAVEEMGMDLTFEADGNNLVYRYELQQALNEEQVAAYRETMEGSYESLKPTLQEVYDGLEEELGNEGLSVTMAYYDQNGTELGTFTYPES
ncbi:MAG TPA: DUF4854 domain-containing protein [Candidatus Gallacutalibacter pullistercoris]|nr:DUF4854 domain-containing protein [Candidatus Gallacutalibacter pullistercoris]